MILLFKNIGKLTQFPKQKKGKSKIFKQQIDPGFLVLYWRQIGYLP